MWCLRLAGNAEPKQSPSGHHRTTLSGCIFATTARITNRKKLVKQQYLPTSPQYGELGPLAVEIGSLVWGTPMNVNGFVSHLGSVTVQYSSTAVGVSQTLRCWTQGTTYIRQGDHHVGHWLTF